MNEVQEIGKKRKRTGRQREEAKRKALETEQPPVETEDGLDSPGKFESADTPAIEKAAPENRIPTALKALHPFFKQARRQEVQRLVKKIKFLRTKPDSGDELKELEAQLALLSHVPLAPIIATHLRLKLSKHARYKHSPLPEAIVTLLSATTDTTASTSAAPSLIAKVENRLCSSKVVAERVKSAVGWIVGEDGARLIRDREAKVPQKQTRNHQDGVVRKPNMAVEQVEEDGLELDPDEELAAQPRLPEGSDEEDEEDAAADAAGWESGSISDLEADSLGSDAKDDVSEELDDGDEAEDDGFAKAILGSLRTGQSKASAPTTQPDKQTKRKREAVTSSTFLPSLATGFMRGDDGSDPDMDYDSDGVIGGKSPLRKNRRGQRARQAIWEKKFGKNAKHVKKARDEEREEARKKAERKSKREEKRAFQTRLTGGKEDRGWAGRPGFRQESPRAAAPQARDRPADSTAQPAQEKQSLHPSWQAARLRRMKEAGGAAGAGTPQATKIVFD